MQETLRDAAQRPVTVPGGSVEAVTRAQLAHCRHWTDAFSHQRKDWRYYEIVEDTICPDFDYRYLIIRDASGEICAIQPIFLLNQDLLAGVGRSGAALAGAVRRWWPGFMRMRTLMMGCAAGEGHLDAIDESSRSSHARLLAAAITTHARDAGASLIVLKEFPAEYRTSMACFMQNGYARVPSLPMVRLNLDYADFEDYLKRGVSRGRRAHLRRNFRDAAAASPIEMSVVSDITPIVDEIYPLYLHVYDRSKLHFELLTKEYFCGIARRMPDKARFFIWRRSGKVVAFSLSMVQNDAIYNEYVGFDYVVAPDVHLYYCTFRDMVNWAIANGYRWMFSGSLAYDPKLHLRFELYPVDLYVRHRSEILNIAFRWLLPVIEPTRYDRTLRRFSNYHELR